MGMCANPDHNHDDVEIQTAPVDLRGVTLDGLVDFLRGVQATTVGVIVCIMENGDSKIWFINPRLFLENSFEEVVKIALPYTGAYGLGSAMLGITAVTPKFDETKLDFVKTRTVLATDWDTSIACLITDSSMARKELMVPFIEKEAVWPFEW